MLKKLITIALVSILFCSFVSAERVSKAVKVVKLHPIASERPGAGGQNLIRIYVESSAWGATDCRHDAVDLKKEDEHLLSILLWGISMEKSIVIEATDELRPFGTVCQVTALFVE